MENQSVTAVVFLDLSAAFDKVDHQILVNMLNRQFWINKIALKYYQTHLNLYPWHFKVAVDNKYTSIKELMFSVPQGSASGADLFSAYCSPLC